MAFYQGIQKYGKIGMSVKNEHEIMAKWNSTNVPLVSVCCITYNHESYIRDAIDSFLMQETDFPFEILIHDDASIDSTAEVIKAYAEKYPSIIRTIIQTENQYSKGGLITPRFLFPVARGKYIALCEGDDYWTDKTKLQKQVTFLENNPEYVITYTDSQPFDETGVLDIDFGGSTRDLSAIELRKATSIFTLTTCFRNVIQEIPQDLRSARYGDKVLWSLLGHYGKGKYLADILPAAYRVHEGGVHSKKTKKEKREMSLITNSALYAYYQKIQDKELSQYFKIQIFKKVLLLMGFGELGLTFLGILFRKIKRAYNRARTLLGVREEIKGSALENRN